MGKVSIPAKIDSSSQELKLSVSNPILMHLFSVIFQVELDCQFKMLILLVYFLIFISPSLNH